MADNKIYTKSHTKRSEFLNINLISQIRKTRKFNVNILFVLLFGVVVLYFVAFIPYNSLQTKYKVVKRHYNNLSYEQQLILEERASYGIDESATRYKEVVDDASSLKVDVNSLFGDLETLINSYGGLIIEYKYFNDMGIIEITVNLDNSYQFKNLNDDFYDFNWIISSGFIQPFVINEGIYYQSVFTLGVDIDV